MIVRCRADRTNVSGARRYMPFRCLAIACLMAIAAARAGDAASATVGKMSAQVKQGFLQQLNDPKAKLNLGLAYWIELNRQGKTYRCNNKHAFRSGDQIRFHVIPNTDGYAYIISKSSSTGRHAVLFPTSETGINNLVSRGRDYALPTSSSLVFDNHPGVEKLMLLLSRTPIDVQKYLTAPDSGSVYVSSEQSGSKDLVPTRMQLCWDDPEPIIMPVDSITVKAATSPAVPNLVSELQAAEAGSVANLDDSSLVMVVCDNPDGVLGVNVALEHLE